MEIKKIALILGAVAAAAIIYGTAHKTEAYGTVTERVCENGLETVTVDTDAGRITSIPGDKPIGSMVTVSHNMWGYTAEVVGE